MSVITRIDARSKFNNSFQVVDKEGNIVAVIEALSTETQLRVSTAGDYEIIKSNGAKLKRKK